MATASAACSRVPTRRHLQTALPSCPWPPLCNLWHYWPAADLLDPVRPVAPPALQLPELAEFEVGLANLFVQHTSASLTINENASPGGALPPAGWAWCQHLTRCLAAACPAHSAP